jgi:antitoxin component of MazEF toxin-antitoxin module
MGKPTFESSRKVQKCGDSLMITLPAFFAKANGIVKGTRMTVIHELRGPLLIFPQDLELEHVLKALKNMRDSIG